MQFNSVILSASCGKRKTGKIIFPVFFYEVVSFVGI